MTLSTPSLDTLSTKREVASLMKVTDRTVDRWMKRKWIPFYKVGSATVRFNIPEVLEHILKPER